MGKKRRRAPALGEDIIIDPKYFDNPVEQEYDPPNAASHDESQQTNVPGPNKHLLAATSTIETKIEPVEKQLQSPQHSESPIEKVQPPPLKHQKPKQEKAQEETNPPEETQSDWPDNGYVDNSVEEISLLSDDTALPSSREPFSAHMTRSLTDAVLANESNQRRQSLIDSDVVVISDSDEDEAIELLSSSAPNSPQKPSSAGSSSSGSSKPAQATRTVSIVLPSVEIRFISHIPDNSITRTQTWGAKTPFYALEKEFGRESVLVYKEKPFKKFQTPNRIDSEAKTMDIHVYTERQWRAKELGEIEEDEPTATDTETERAADEFPITIEGKEHKLRTLVSNSTTIQEVADRFIEQFSSSQTVKVLFDGDQVDLTTTVGDLELEEDDILNIYN